MLTTIEQMREAMNDKMEEIARLTSELEIHQILLNKIESKFPGLQDNIEKITNLPIDSTKKRLKHTLTLDAYSQTDKNESGLTGAYALPLDNHAKGFNKTPKPSTSSSTRLGEKSKIAKYSKEEMYYAFPPYPELTLADIGKELSFNNNPEVYVLNSVSRRRTGF